MYFQPFSPGSKVLWSLLFLFASTYGQPCYWKSNDTVRSQDAAGIYPCPNTEEYPGGTQMCCLVGSQCGIDGICRFPEATIDGGPPNSPGRSGWNTGGCTDPSYTDPVCPTECNDWGRYRIVWDVSTSLWHCCGHENCTSTPTNETFEAVSPQDWRAVNATLNSTSSSPTSTFVDSTSTSTGTGTTAASASTSSESGSGLSTAAKAGIGVSSTIVGLGIVIAALYFLWRKRRPLAAAQETDKAASNTTPDQSQDMTSDIPLKERGRSEAMSEQKHEMSTETGLAPPELGEGRVAPRELSTDRGRYELEGSGP